MDMKRHAMSVLCAIVVLCLSLTVSSIHAQESQAKENDESAEEVHVPQLRGAIMMANTHVPQATEDGKKLAIVPTWGVDLDYRFASRWSVALQADVKIQSFEIEDDQAVVERSYPLALAFVMNYHLKKHWAFFLGPGFELEKHKNYFLMKAGAEYSFEITEKFEIALNLQYENKQRVYDGWTFGVSFNKQLWKKE